MSEVHIGVVIYCKNNEGTIVNAIESIVKNQTVLPKAVCVIDNASTDGSWDKICGTFGAKVASFEFKANINGIDVIGLQNEFEDEVFTSFRDGISLLWNQVDFFGLLNGKDYFLAEKIERSIEYMEDENFHHIYSDFWYNPGTGIPARAYYTTHWTDHPDIGFFRKEIFEKIKLTEVDSFDTLNKIVRQNYLVAHIPEALHYVNYKTRSG